MKEIKVTLPRNATAEQIKIAANVVRSIERGKIDLQDQMVEIHHSDQDVKVVVRKRTWWD